MTVSTYVCTYVHARSNVHAAILQDPGYYHKFTKQWSPQKYYTCMYVLYCMHHTALMYVYVCWYVYACMYACMFCTYVHYAHILHDPLLYYGVCMFGTNLYNIHVMYYVYRQITTYVHEDCLTFSKDISVYLFILHFIILQINSSSRRRLQQYIGIRTYVQQSNKLCRTTKTASYFMTRMYVCTYIHTYIHTYLAFLFWVLEC